MARKSATRIMKDAYRKKPGSKPSRVSLIVDGVKYKAGQNPARVCPQKPAVRRGLSQPV